jgi:hypothetical protein
MTAAAVRTSVTAAHAFMRVSGPSPDVCQRLREPPQLYLA